MSAKKKLKNVGFVAILSGVLGVSGIARGQTAANPPAYTTSPAEAAQPSTPAVQQAPILPIDVLMQRNGGSLARAEMAEQNSNAATANTASYYSVPEPKPKLLKVHDLVTIVVRKDSQYTTNGTTDLKHSADLDAIIDSYVSLNMNHGLNLAEHSPTTPLEVKSSGVRDFNGQAQLNRADSLSAQITASVFDVKPNGTLVLQATKSIKTDEEEQTFKLYGTCRVQDIAADNTVLSTQLSDLHLDKQHKGAAKDTMERGLVQRLLDSINPF